MNKTAIQAESFHRVNTIELVPTPKIDSENEDSNQWRLQNAIRKASPSQAYINEAKV